MVVMCIENRIDHAKEDEPLYEYLLKTNKYDRPILPINPGRVAHVMALETFLRNLWIYICEPPNMPYPTRFPITFFSVLDSRASKLWDWEQTPLEGMNLDLNVEQLISFPEWVSDRNFYEHLLDGDPTVVAQFAAARRYIENESQLNRFGSLP